MATDPFVPFPDLVCVSHSLCGASNVLSDSSKRCPTCGGTADIEVLQTTRAGVSQRPPPRSIVTAPTVGRDLRHYSFECLLHVGITDSAGVVHDFDSAGIHIGRSWGVCLAVPLDETASSAAEWDAALAEQVRDDLARGEGYESLGNNCYAFVIRALNALAYAGRRDHNKLSFSSRYIEPGVTAFETYLHAAAALPQYSPAHIPLRGTPAAAGGGQVAICDACSAVLSAGDRYKCVVCPDFDLCDQCYRTPSADARRFLASSTHGDEHAMKRL